MGNPAAPIFISFCAGRRSGVGITMKTIKAILIGAGSRGYSYASIMKNNGFQIVAVADPLKERVKEIREMYGIPEEMCFARWEDLLALPKCADLALITTSDHLHYQPSMKALSLGYDLLLEKPVAPTAQECADIANLAKEKGAKVLVCHELRYAPFFRKLKELIKQGLIGDVMSIHHAEGVGIENYVHSFVRGIWNNSETSSDMLLAKSCHDMDLIQWYMGCDCIKAQSFGSRIHFRRENAPEGSPEFCIEGCPHADECPYDAVKIYAVDDGRGNLWRRHAFRGKCETIDQVRQALHTTEFGEYGKCAYKCSNNVVDTQVVDLEFENGRTASFNMTSLSSGGRSIRIIGTKGDLAGSASDDAITYFNLLTRERTRIPTSDIRTDETIAGGHGGGDTGIIKTLYSYLAGESVEPEMLSEIEISVKNHLIVFAAEQSRRENRVVDVAELTKQLLK